MDLVATAEEMGHWNKPPSGAFNVSSVNSTNLGSILIFASCAIHRPAVFYSASTMHARYFDVINPLTLLYGLQRGKTGLLADPDPIRGSDQEVFNFSTFIAGLVWSVWKVCESLTGRVGSGRVGSGRVGSGRVGSGRVGSGRVG